MKKYYVIAEILGSLMCAVLILLIAGTVIMANTSRVAADTRADITDDIRTDVTDMTDVTSETNESSSMAASGGSITADESSETGKNESPQDVSETPQLEFSDIEALWSKNGIMYVLEKGYMEGLTETEFAPKKAMTRAMFVASLGNMAGTTGMAEYAAEKFLDIDGTESFAPQLAWASASNIVYGSEGRFYPQNPIDRQTMAVMIARAAEMMDVRNVEDEWSAGIDYKDLSDVSTWAVEGVAYCSAYGIMSGYPNKNFEPQRILTREEAAVILQRLDQKFVFTVDENMLQ